MIRLAKIRIPLFSLISLTAFFIIEPSLYMILTLCCVSLHEIGHLIMMKLFKTDIATVTLLPLGIDIRSVPKLISYPKKLLIALGGPLVNLLLFAILHNTKGDLFFFALLNLLYALFNLLPIKGLDGAQILQSVLNIFISQEKTEKILRMTSFLFCILLWMTGIYILFILNGNISVFALSLFLYVSIFLKS